MSQISPLSLHNRRFVPIENSAGGIVDDRTVFQFTQTGDVFHATYSGGDILSGHIIGQFTGPRSGKMLYHCQTQDEALKAGRADAVFELGETGQLTMSLNWEWVSGADGSGTSKYIEIAETLL